jgi:hypothetical protein
MNKNIKFMKNNLLLLFVCMFLMVAFSGKAFTVTNSTLITQNIVFSLDSGKTGFPQNQFESDELIHYAFVGTSTNYIHYRILPMSQGFDFRLLDNKDREVPKTDRGIANSQAVKSPKERDEINKFKFQVVRQDIKYLHALFRPDEMFVITNKGVYELEVRSRICVPMTNGVPDTNAMTSLHGLVLSTNFSVIVSDPVRVKVIKD